MRETDALANALASAVGVGYVLGGDAAAAFAVDGVAPRLVVRPGTQEEVESVVRTCAKAGAAMAPWGGGTAMGLGNPPRRLDVAVLLERLTRIVDLDDANLNVSAEAGVTLASLQTALAAKREFLPLDPPRPERATVGGLIQCNATGPSRQLYGTVRDWVLGLRAVLPSGERIRCGGKVIKNVSGYDMNKLFVGGFGTMGIVTEATFKLLPLPAARATVLGVFPALGGVDTAVARTLESFLIPEALEALDPGTLASIAADASLAAPSGYGLAVSLAGSPETVERQARDFRALFVENGATFAETLGAALAEPAWRAIRDVHAADAGARVVAKIAVPIGKTLDLFASAEELVGHGGARGAVTAHAGAGVVRVHLPIGPADALDALRRDLAALRTAAEDEGGSLVLEAAPPALKKSLDAWGSTRDALALTRRLKAELDPGALLNPGRFVGGI
jgi:glycolate oxidase FAD binding subunit